MILKCGRLPIMEVLGQLLATAGFSPFVRWYFLNQKDPLRNLPPAQPFTAKLEQIGFANSALRHHTSGNLLVS